MKFSMRPYANGAGRMAAWILLASLSGCATFGPAPWEKDLMAKKTMQLGDNGVVNAMNDHIYFSKEGAAGGRSTAGGGCGCN